MTAGTIEARRPPGQRLAGLAGLVVLFAVPVALATGIVPAGWPVGVLFIAAPAAAGFAASSIWSGVRIEPGRVRIVTPLRIWTVPAGRLHGIRIDGAALGIAREPDVVMSAGPFEPDGSAAASERIGELVAALREEAVAQDDRGVAPSREPGPAVPVALGWLALVAVAIGLAASRG
jgi:hypothetical protein